MEEMKRARYAEKGQSFCGLSGHHCSQSPCSPIQKFSKPHSLGILWQLHYINMMTKPLVVVLISQSSLTFFHPMDYVAARLLSELKWTRMGEFNSDDHYIYYCGWESLRRDGVAIIVNKRV